MSCFLEIPFQKKSSDVAIDYMKKISEGKLERVKGEEDSKQIGMKQVTQHLEAKERKKLMRNWSISGASVGGGAVAIGYALALLNVPIAIGVFAVFFSVSLIGSRIHIFANEKK